MFLTAKKKKILKKNHKLKLSTIMEMIEILLVFLLLLMEILKNLSYQRHYILMILKGPL